MLGLCARAMGRTDGERVSFCRSLPHAEQKMNEHTDVVKCLISLGNRAYSGG